MRDNVRRFIAAFAVLGISMLSLASPAKAVPPPTSALALSNCYAHSICAFNTISPPPLGTVIMPNRDVGDAPRNTCFADFNGYPQTFTIINNSGYRWYLFRTSACSGSHIDAPPYDEFHVPAGWEEIHAWFRTSTTS